MDYDSGSYTHAWMLKEHPKLVTRSCFVDPVTFCSWEGGKRTPTPHAYNISHLFFFRRLLQLLLQNFQDGTPAC